VAEPVLPVPPLVEVTAPVVLTLFPEVVVVTFKLTAQEPLAAILPPVRLTLPVPAVAVAVPPKVLVRPDGVATTSPLGKVSVTATPLKAVAPFGSVMVKVKLVVPPTTTLAAPNALLIDGGATTSRLAWFPNSRVNFLDVNGIRVISGLRCCVGANT